MSGLIRPFCVKCQKEYRVRKQGVTTELMTKFGDKPVSYELYDSDLWECPVCGHQIIGGYGREPLARHYDENYQEVLKKVGKTYKCW